MGKRRIKYKMLVNRNYSLGGFSKKYPTDKQKQNVW